MKHLGDITKLKGSEVPLTEIVVGGSPCQDLSVAGKRKGLAGERSGLFMEQIRLIKEMRNESFKQLSMQGTVDPSRIIPRFMVWENVPGAFSSNNGEDFRAVLEETARVKDKDAAIPRLEGKQKWSPSGCIMGDGWSIAWRVHDAQFWGVPQRRKRIALVADFGGGAAPEILFECKSMSGNSAESGEARKGTAEDAERGVGETGITCLNDQGGSVMAVSENVTGALRAQEHGHQPLVFEPGAASRLGGYCYNDMCGTLRADMGDNQPAVCYGISSYESNAMKSANPHSGIYEADTSRTLDLNGGNPACNQGGIAVVFDASRRHNYEPFGDVSETVQAHYGTGGGNVPIVLEGNGSRPSHQGDGYKEGDTMYTLNSTEHHAVCYRGDAITSPVNASNPQPGDPCHTLTDDSRNYVVLENHPADSRVKISEDGMVQTLSSRMGTGGGNVPMIMKNETVVRRLTPLECERLQGYPDGWTDIGDWVDSKGKKHKGESDAPRYKALGNSIALPFWEWMAGRMVKQLKQDGFENPTMASLFDGIGGFPLVFSRNGCKPIWASEIEEFPIAVTKIRFSEENK